MNRELLERFAQLKVEEKRIKHQIEFLQPEVLKEVSAVYDGQPITTEAIKDIGAYTISMLKTWTFSDDLVALQQSVKEQEASEKSNGRARFVEKESLTFNPKK